MIICWYLVFSLNDWKESVLFYKGKEFRRKVILEGMGRLVVDLRFRNLCLGYLWGRGLDLELLVLGGLLEI